MKRIVFWLLVKIGWIIDYECYSTDPGRHYWIWNTGQFSA